MSIIRVKKDKNNPYLIMNKTALDDKRLSLKAKGLIAYLLSKPDDWYVNTNDIVSHCSNGIGSVWTSIKELIHYGYIYKHQFRSNNGRFYNYNYLVYESPKKLTSTKTYTQPDCGFPSSDNPSSDNSPLLINKTKRIIKEPLTTLFNKSNNVNVAKNDQSLIESRKSTSQLLNELYIKDHQFLFDNFEDWDIFCYADWMLTFKQRIKNPTGFLIASIKGQWLDTNKYFKIPDNFGKDSQL